MNNLFRRTGIVCIFLIASFQLAACGSGSAGSASVQLLTIDQFKAKVDPRRAKKHYHMKDLKGLLGKPSSAGDTPWMFPVWDPISETKTSCFVHFNCGVMFSCRSMEMEPFMVDTVSC